LPDAESKVNQKIIRKTTDTKRCGFGRKCRGNCKYCGCFLCREKLFTELIFELLPQPIQYSWQNAFLNPNTVAFQYGFALIFVNVHFEKDFG